LQPKTLWHIFIRSWQIVNLAKQIKCHQSEWEWGESER